MKNIFIYSLLYLLTITTYTLATPADTDTDTDTEDSAELATDVKDVVDFGKKRDSALYAALEDETRDESKEMSKEMSKSAAEKWNQRIVCDIAFDMNAKDDETLVWLLHTSTEHPIPILRLTKRSVERHINCLPSDINKEHRSVLNKIGNNILDKISNCFIEVLLTASTSELRDGTIPTPLTGEEGITNSTDTYDMTPSMKDDLHTLLDNVSLESIKKNGAEVDFRFLIKILNEPLEIK